MSRCDLFSNTRNISPTCAVKMSLRERESEKDGWYPRTTMAGRLTNSFNSGWKLSSSRITAIIQTCEKCWTSQSVVFSGSGWTGGLPYGTFPMDISTTQTAAWEAGEPFLGMRGSYSFRGMEGFKEKRGERSFKTLWRLAAVGRAAVFPKSPPNRKNGLFSSLSLFFFFPHCIRATSTPPQPKARTYFELQGGCKSFY